MKKHYKSRNLNSSYKNLQTSRHHVPKPKIRMVCLSSKIILMATMFFSLMQLIFFVRTLYFFSKIHDELLPAVHQHQLQWINNGARENNSFRTANESPPTPTTTMSSTVIVNTSCFPPRYEQKNTDPHTIVYLEMAWFDEHSETLYSFIHEICSCDEGKNSRWTVVTMPHFYVGPEEMVLPGFQKILREYNTTTCGPIFFGTPAENPDLTIVTTSYMHNFIKDEGENQYRKLINDTHYIFIVHGDDPSLEYDAENAFFLTPWHKRYILPTYFPPTLVPPARSGSTNQPPIFLVLGTFQAEKGKRDLPSLMYALEKYRDVRFRIRFVGGSKADGKQKDQLVQELHATFPNHTDKIEFFPRPDTDEFMTRVAESDVILPLINSELFRGKYQNGKRLTSSVAWGLGFQKKIILYRPLADVFGIQEDNVTYFLHGENDSDSSTFADAFGRCLRQYWNVSNANSKQL